MHGSGDGADGSLEQASVVDPLHVTLDQDGHNAQDETYAACKSQRNQLSWGFSCIATYL